jgi:photosystem II stability/assembly factor-like uncharacterized protein
MWKSTDGGTSWRKTTAPDQLHSVSCIAQNEDTGHEDTWYYGTGEWSSGMGGSASGPLGTGAVYRGDGIFKSTDSGENWALLPSTVSGTPTATDSFDFISVFAATSTGLFKSTDGGDSWQHVIDFGEKYPSTDIAMTSLDTCYAAVAGDGTYNGIYKSADGETWEDITPVEWPDTTDRTVIAIAPSNENVIYFLTEVAYLKQELRKYEVGVGWTDLSANLPFGGEMITYGGKMLILYVKPDDHSTLFVGTVGLYRSTDGGGSFEQIGAYNDFHVDQHSIAFYPSNPSVMIVGNDGGLFKTYDNIAEVQSTPYGDQIDWESLNNGYVTTQFYAIALDHGTPGSETILGGTQDNSWLFTTSSDPQVPWTSIWKGATDGGFSAISDSGDYFYTSQAATFHIWRHWYEGQDHHFTEVTMSDTAGGSLWLPPFILDPHDTKMMYLPWRTLMWRNSDLTEIPEIVPGVPTDVNWTQLDSVKDYYICPKRSPGDCITLRYMVICSRWTILTKDSPYRLSSPATVYLRIHTFIASLWILEMQIRCWLFLPTMVSSAYVIPKMAETAGHRSAEIWRKIPTAAAMVPPCAGPRFCMLRTNPSILQVPVWDCFPRPTWIQ